LSNFVEHTIDASGDLYLKYFFADSSFTERPTAIGHFSIHRDAIGTRDQEAIGLPFTILPKQELSAKGDWHPWSTKPGATFEDHIEFAKSFSPGHIVRLTTESNTIGGSVDNIKANNGRFAIVKITDRKARDAFIRDPNLIPKAVSPGFLNLDTPNLEGIRNFRWVHLAAVPRGAFGDKATVYGSCVGGNECVNHLIGASEYEQAKNSYCAVGASERQNLVTSHDISKPSDTSMSANANTTEQPVTTTTSPPTAPVGSTTAPPPVPSTAAPKGAPITTGTPEKKGIVRLKTAVTPQGNSQLQETDDLAKLREEVNGLREIQQKAERREQIKRLIPKELFINKGKFDEKAFEAEVDKRLQSNQTDEQINEIYTLWMDKQKLINAGIQLPQTQTQASPMADIPAGPAPTGGSYITPSEVPTVGGSAIDQGKYVNSHIRELLTRVIVRNE